MREGRGMHWRERGRGTGKEGRLTALPASLKLFPVLNLIALQVFDLGPFREFWSSRIKARKIEELKFDQERYEYLIKLRDR